MKGGQNWQQLARIPEWGNGSLNTRISDAKKLFLKVSAMKQMSIKSTKNKIEHKKKKYESSSFQMKAKVRLKIGRKHSSGNLNHQSIKSSIN